MIKLLIVDDEPLVCVGISSMLCWNDFGVEIVGTARNGLQAFEMITELAPDIVITDIKMPIKTGLELVEESMKQYGDIPVFIILTSYEDFEFARKAIRLNTVDYLIKIELTAESLAEAVKTAIEALNKHSKKTAPVASTSQQSLQMLHDKFFIRLYNNLFENEEQYEAQKKDLSINLSSPQYVVFSCKTITSEIPTINNVQALSLCTSVVNIVRETLGKIYPCYVTMLDMHNFSIVVCFGSNSLEEEAVFKELQAIADMAHNYFSVSILIGSGIVVNSPKKISYSYKKAQKALQLATLVAPFILSEKEDTSDNALSFDFSYISDDIRKAFEELDLFALHHILTTIADKLRMNQKEWLSAMEIACNLLYMAISLLPDGNKNIQEIFKDEPEGYRSIYYMHSTDEIIQWVLTLRDGSCKLFSEQQQTYMTQTVEQVKLYIQNNLSKQLSLTHVASIFNFRPNYLSQLFAKYSTEGFVEYITNAKIRAAKEMLLNGTYKIYEIAEKLGFDNAFYFSKVFKKIEGVSPREYRMKIATYKSK